MKNSRRTFMLTSASVALGLSVGSEVFAQAKLDEGDAQAKVLGYVSDNTKADKTKYPNKAAGQMCGNCQLFQGTPGQTSGPCPIFGGKTVSSTGWCSAYTKKP